MTEPSYEVVHDGVPEEQRPEALITAEASSAKLDAVRRERERERAGQDSRCCDTRRSIGLLPHARPHLLTHPFFLSAHPQSPPPHPSPQLQIEDFARRLDVNMGRFAVGLAKRSRIAVAPRRPAEGWSLLVKPLGAGAGGEGAAPFVAMPDGKQRPLSQLERDYVELNKVRPRRKLN